METRQAPRVKLNTKISLSLDNQTKEHFDILDKNIEAEALDISTLGVGLTAKHFFPQGSVLRLSFTLSIGPDKEQKSSINARGEVRSAVAAGKGIIRLGVRFQDLTEEQKDIIKKFVSENEGAKA